MSIKPAKRPEQSLRALHELLDDAKVDRARDRVCVVMIRGFFRDSMGKPGENDFGLYDDAAFIVTPDKVLAFNCNTDPSKATAGLAVVCPGVHRYKRGTHNVSKSKDKQYPAWIPNTPGKKLPVKRVGQSQVSIGVACNIHRGGNNSTSSAGCQTIPPDQWGEFDKALETLLKQYGQGDFPRLMWEKPSL